MKGAQCHPLTICCWLFRLELNHLVLVNIHQPSVATWSIGLANLAFHTTNPDCREIGAMASSAADSHTWSSVFQEGIPFLGAFKTGQAKVLLIQGDEPERFAERKFRRQELKRNLSAVRPLQMPQLVNGSRPGATPPSCPARLQCCAGIKAPAIADGAQN